jgi:hypothetical protein
MRRSLVYIRRRLSDGKALYIGSSTDGLSRPLARTHEKARLSEGEVLEVYLTDSPRELEARLILNERPELNYNGPNSSVHSSVKAALYCAVCERPLSNCHGRAVFCSSECQKAARLAPQECKTLREKLWTAQAAQKDYDARLGGLVKTLVKQARLLAKEVGLAPEDMA